MKDLTPLEKEFWNAMNKTKWHPELLQSESWRASIDSIRDVAALCERKIKEKEHEKNQQIDNIIKKRKKQESEKIRRAIELARQKKIDSFGNKWPAYTEEQILELLNK